MRIAHDRSVYATLKEDLEYPHLGDCSVRRSAAVPNTKQNVLQCKNTNIYKGYLRKSGGILHCRTSPPGSDAERLIIPYLGYAFYD
jgi:hypothetical protein